jgi:hypothetical protein
MKATREEVPAAVAPPPTEHVRAATVMQPRSGPIARSCHQE